MRKIIVTSSLVLGVLFFANIASAVTTPVYRGKVSSVSYSQVMNDSLLSQFDRMIANRQTQISLLQKNLTALQAKRAKFIKDNNLVVQ